MLNQKDTAVVKAAAALGRNVKSQLGIGKEHYVLVCTAGDVLLDWVYQKALEFVPSTKTGNFSTSGVVVGLMKKDVFWVPAGNFNVFCINKKRFKRFIKKAVQNSMLKH